VPAEGDRNGRLLRLDEDRPLLLDGGLGSRLIARGLPAGAPPEIWNLERPEEVLAVHRAYVEAGSDVVHSNTFGANAVRLGRFNAADRLEEINLAGVRLARRAGPRLVFGDVGPTGEYLPPVGAGDPARWREHYREQARILAGAGVDAFHLETMSDLREALVACESLQGVAPRLPVFVSLTFEKRRRGFFTIMGDPLSASLQRLSQAGAAVVGANCTLASGDMTGLAMEALSLPGLSLVLQPNAGAPQMGPSGPFYAQDPEEFAAEVSAWVARGRSARPGEAVSTEAESGREGEVPPKPESRIAAVGGCCGTDENFIAALSRRLAALG
jgi:5-methyltetrahydrofolate--homocysteine methyltransferase